MKVSNKSTGAMSFNLTIARLYIRAVNLLFVLLIVNALGGREAFASVVNNLPNQGSAQVIPLLAPPCGTLDGITIDPMEAVGDWHVSMGNGAITATLTTVPGYNGQALQLNYDLGMTPGAYVQLVREFNPSHDLSAGDHLRFFYQGTTINTLEVGMTSDAGENYFGRSWNDVTHVPWWTYAIWDFQDFLKDDIQPFPDSFSKVKAIFISVTKKDNGVGGIGSLTVDELQYLNIASRTVPSAFKFVTADPTVTQRAATWIGDQQQPSHLLKSWQEESAPNAWLYDQALGLIVLSETDLPRAEKLARKLHELQNTDGYWYAGYNSSTAQPIDITKKPVGANAWIIYALTHYYLKSGDQTAYQDALKGADWLDKLQRPDGSLPGELRDPPDTGAPTEANLDAWWAFHATGHKTQSRLIRKFLLDQVWDSTMGRFKSTGNAYPEKYRIFLDNQTWGAAFLHAIGRDTDARRALSYARWTLAWHSSNERICGFDGAGPFSVWNEGTLQYIAAHGEKSKSYWRQMVRQQSSDGGLSGSPEPTEFRGYIVWLTPWHGVVPTSWLYFAGTGGPFWKDGKGGERVLPVIGP